MIEKNYQLLKNLCSDFIRINQITSILHWDSQTQMPKNGFRERKKQIELLESIANQLISNPKNLNLISACDESKLSSYEKRDLALIKKMVRHRISVPEKLRSEFLHLALKTEFIWREAKKNKDFPLFNQYFSPLMKLLREIAQIKSEALNLTPYETLLDLYDEGRSEKQLDQVFGILIKELPIIIENSIEKQRASQAIFNEDYHKQKLVFTKLIQHFGVNKNWCRLDESLHPFCTGYRGDVRITSRYENGNIISSLMAVIHESGHALYDNNLPEKYSSQMIGQNAGMALHESQSLFLEMQIARSYSFCEFLSPILSKAFPKENFEAKNLYQNLNKVKKSYIRVDADEVTYPLHVALRYEIEKMLIYGEISTDQIPDIWNEKLQKYFGLKAAKIDEGCLQDIHWSDGSLGYFPTYSLGAIYAAQIAQKTKELLPDFESLVRLGKFKKILGILKENIHQKASISTAEEIIQDFTGHPLSPEIFIGYLRNKYTG